MELTKDDVLATFERPVFTFIEAISNEPLTNSYYIEIHQKNPLKVSVTVTSATVKHKPSSSHKLTGELKLKNKTILTVSDEKFLLKFIAMNALISFCHTLEANGVKIDRNDFLKELSDEELEKSQVDKTSLN